MHVPPYIKSTIWPQDLHWAITHLRKATDNGVASSDHDRSSEPIMASLERPLPESQNSQPGSSNAEVQVTVPQLPDETTENSTPTTTSPASLTSAPISATPTVPPQPPYPHQPYGYPPVAYPHAPYYPPPLGYPHYPPPSYPHYSSPLPNAYPHPQSHPVLPAPHPTRPSSSAYHVQQSIHPERASDDLPSYEEMIVEALQEFTDPEGCAPKDLFASMAAKYPLQFNFRPSASQALQKAFKRGRLEKANNGKYRLNTTWEGGSVCVYSLRKIDSTMLTYLQTSRRATRRPQTQMQQTNAAVSSPRPPFTYVPLIREQCSLQYAGYPYPCPYPGYAGYPQPHPQTQPQPSQPASSEVVADATDKAASGFDPSSGVDKDAYEAAQNILKAINFGDLFQIASENGGDGKKSNDVSVDQLTSLLVQAQNVMSAQMDDVPHAASPPAASLPTLSVAAGVAVPATLECPKNIRAELQAQLALLAAQLAELSQERAENVDSSGEQTQAGPLSVSELRPQLQQPPSCSYPQTQLQSSAMLTHPSLDAQAQIQEPLATSVPQSYRLNQHLQQYGDALGYSESIPTEASNRSTPIPTTLSPKQTLPVVATSLSLEVASEPTTILTMPASRLELPSSLTASGSKPTSELSSAPTLQKTTTHALGSRPEPHASAQHPVQGETDSEDDDMEEIV